MLLLCPLATHTHTTYIIQLSFLCGSCWSIFTIIYFLDGLISPSSPQSLAVQAPLGFLFIYEHVKVIVWSDIICRVDHKQPYPANSQSLFIESGNSLSIDLLPVDYLWLWSFPALWDLLWPSPQTGWGQWLPLAGSICSAILRAVTNSAVPCLSLLLAVLRLFTLLSSSSFASSGIHRFKVDITGVSSFISFSERVRYT